MRIPLDFHLTSRRSPLVDANQNLADVQLVLNAEDVAQVRLAQLQQEFAVHAGLLERSGVDLQRQTIQPTTHVLHRPRADVLGKSLPSWKTLATRRMHLLGLCAVFTVRRRGLIRLFSFFRGFGYRCCRRHRRSRGASLGGGRHSALGDVDVHVAHLRKRVDRTEVGQRHGHELELHELLGLREHGLGAALVLLGATGGGGGGRCRRGRRRFQLDALLSQRVQLLLLLRQERHEISLRAAHLSLLPLSRVFHVAQISLEPLERSSLPCDIIVNVEEFRLQLSTTPLPFRTLRRQRHLESPGFRRRTRQSCLWMVPWLLFTTAEDVVPLLSQALNVRLQGVHLSQLALENLEVPGARQQL
eukprot:scaffold664_cov260-Pinguiococcus_pyrenoidosus.AAC.38